MAYSRGYTRIFVTLQQECGDYNQSLKQAMGRGILEIRHGVGRLLIHMQGLKPQISYKICMLSHDSYCELKSVEVDNSGKCECRWEFNPDSIVGTSLKLEDIKAIGILVENKAPLMGYINNKYNWQNCLNTQQIDETEHKEAIIEHVEDVLSEPVEEALSKPIEKALSKPIEEAFSKPVEETLSETIEETTQSVQDDDRSSLPHEKFKKIIYQFNEDLQELKYYATMKETDDRDIKHIFDTYIKVEPFGKDSIHWIKINLKELSLIGKDLWKYANNPFVTYGCKKHKHLILGKTEQGYILGVPCDYDPAYKLEANLQGFDEFRKWDGSAINKGDFCYCLLKI